MRQRLDVGHRDSRHLIRECDINASGFHPEAELDWVAVKLEIVYGIDDFDSRQLSLGQNVLARASGPIEEELPERAWTDCYEGYQFVPAGEPNLCFRLQAVDIDRHCRRGATR